MKGRLATIFSALLLASACSAQSGGPAALPNGALLPPSPTPISPLQLAAPTFPAGEVGAAYLPTAFAAAGGVKPYKWAVSSGALPDGLTLGGDGSVSGTPKSAGTFAFTIQLTDARGGSSSVQGSIPVTPALAASLIAACSRACQVEAGCVDVCGTFGLLSGGTPPYSYSASGNIPPGVHLSEGLAYAGTFSRPVSYWQSTVTVTDSFGETVNLSPVFNVSAHLSFPGSTITNCPWLGCQRSLLYSGGLGTPRAAVTGWTFSGKCTGYPTPPNPCPPPMRPTVSVGGSNVVINVPGPGGFWVNGYQGTLTVQLTDQSLCGPNANCTTTGVVTVVVSGG